MAADNESSNQDPWSLQRGRADMLSSGQSSDCQLHVGGHCLHLHRSILMGCRYYQKLFGGYFQESDCATAISFDHPALVARVIQFIYCDDYSSSDVSASSQPGQGLFGFITDRYASRNKQSLLHATMYSLGDRYCLPQLKALARKKFSCSFFTLDGSPPSAPFCIIAVMKEVYAGTPHDDRGLRDFICLGIHTNLEECDYAKSKRVLEVLDQPTALNREIWADLLRYNLMPGEYRCEACGDIGVILNKKKCCCLKWGDTVHSSSMCRNLQEASCLMCEKIGTLVEYVDDNVTAWDDDKLEDASISW